MLRVLALLIAIAVCAAGCDVGSDSDDEAQRTTTATTTTTTTSVEQRFERTDLTKLALPAASAPKGMRLTKADSGPKELMDVGIALQAQVRELRSLGFVAVHDAIFDSTDKRKDLRVAQRLWLFKTPAGAMNWMERTQAYASAVGFQALQTKPLGDSSWAASATLPDSDVITHAFRIGNLVVQVASTTQRGRLSGPDALAAAEAAAKRIAG